MILGIFACENEAINMFAFIKKFFLRKSIEENKNPRNIYITSLQKAKNIGIVCNITDEDSYKRIFSLFSKLHATGRLVWLMGYIDDKEVPFYCLQQLTADYFCNKDLNWYGKPVKVQIDDFVKRDFDLVIDFTKQFYPVIQYMLTLTQAHFIVGSNKEYADLYDLYIDAENMNDHMALLEQVYIYTKQLTGGE